jgi:hypothetical protein
MQFCCDEYKLQVVQTRAGDTRALTHITFGIVGRFSSFMNTPEFTACSLLQVYNVCASPRAKRLGDLMPGE